MAGFSPMNTKDDSTSFRKVLLYSHAGWGKTTQAKHYTAHYGSGFIISGEAGLSSIRKAGIDYLPFQSFDGKVDPANGIYSFVEICRLISTPEFKAVGYKWIMLDSLTELSDMLMAWATAKAEATAKEMNKKVNGFEKYGEYGDKMLAACRYIRDLPYHVIISALAKETENENGDREIWPAVHGSKIQMQIPGVFDCVLCGVKTNVKAADGKGMEVRRLIVTDEYKGWHGKVRDENRVISAVEQTDSVIDIIKRLEEAERN
jgi:hypothetical protein